MNYERRATDFGRELARLERRGRLNGNLNVLLFFAAAAALTIGAVREQALWYWVAGGLAVAFIAGLATLQKTKQAVAHAAALVALNQEGLARLTRTWAALPAPAGPAAAAEAVPLASPLAQEGRTPLIDPATAADLDLLGPGSLQHLLNTAATPIGQAPPAEISGK